MDIFADELEGEAQMSGMDASIPEMINQGITAAGQAATQVAQTIQNIRRPQIAPAPRPYSGTDWSKLLKIGAVVLIGGGLAYYFLKRRKSRK